MTLVVDYAEIKAFGIGTATALATDLLRAFFFEGSGHACGPTGNR